MTPGSYEARKKGCLCPRIDNHHGEGYKLAEDGKPVFYVNPDCKLHKHLLPKKRRDR